MSRHEFWGDYDSCFMIGSYAFPRSAIYRYSNGLRECTTSYFKSRRYTLCLSSQRHRRGFTFGMRKPHGEGTLPFSVASYMRGTS